MSRKGKRQPKSNYSTKKTTQTKLPPLEHKNATQRRLISLIRTGEQTFVTGPAGTGKTYIAARIAADMYDAKDVCKIILTRPNVPSGPTLGLFKGSMEEKMAAWVVPILYVLERALGASRVDYAMKRGHIEVVPFETMRGRTFDDAFILLDEAQNTTPHEMQMFLTRIGEHSKVVVNGDLMQSDLKHTSGLTAAIRLMGKYGIRAGHVEFTLDDIVRSGLCAEWVRAFYTEAA
jgi:phosphate starvation-inducible PhoH-like protein